MDGVEHGWCNDGDGRLTHSAPEIMARDDHRFDLRHLRKTHDLIGIEVQIHHASIPDAALAVEGGSQPIGHRPFDLGGDLVRVYCVAAIEGQHQPVHLELATIVY